MFEIGFAELFLLGVIALLVVGPDRLPGLVRTVGMWVGKAQRLVGQVRADIEREVRADELRKAAKEYSPTAALSDMRKEVEDFASEVSRPVDLDAKKAGPEEKSEGAGSESGKVETGKDEASDGGPAGAAEPAESAATEPKTDTFGADEPETPGRPAEDPAAPERAAGSPEETAGAATAAGGPDTAEPDADAVEVAGPLAPGRAEAKPETAATAVDTKPTDRRLAPVAAERAEIPPAEADERSAAA